MNKHSVNQKILTSIAVIYNFGLSIIAILWLMTNKMDGSKQWLFGAKSCDPKYPQMLLFSFFFAGMLGGTIYGLRSVYLKLAEAYNPNNPDGTDPTKIFNIDVWLYWYLYRPFQSGIIAVIIFALFKEGILILQVGKTEQHSSIFFQLGLGFLIGFGSSSVFDKIKEVTEVIFAGKEKKQP